MFDNGYGSYPTSAGFFNRCDGAGAGFLSRDLCARIRSANDRRSHNLVLTDKGRAVLARARKLVAAKHEARLNELLGPANRAALLEMLTRIAREF